MDCLCGRGLGGEHRGQSVESFRGLRSQGTQCRSDGGHLRRRAGQHATPGTFPVHPVIPPVQQFGAQQQHRGLRHGVPVLRRRKPGRGLRHSLWILLKIRGIEQQPTQLVGVPLPGLGQGVHQQVRPDRQGEPGVEGIDGDRCHSPDLRFREPHTAGVSGPAYSGGHESAPGREPEPQLRR